MQRCRAKILKKGGSYRHCKRSTTGEDHLCWQHALCADQTAPRCVVSIGDHPCKRKGHARCGGKCWQHASIPEIAEPGFCCCICLAEPSGSMVVQLGSCGHRVHAHCLDTMISTTLSLDNAKENIRDINHIRHLRTNQLVKLLLINGTEQQRKCDKYICSEMN